MLCNLVTKEGMPGNNMSVALKARTMFFRPFHRKEDRAGSWEPEISRPQNRTTLVSYLGFLLL